MTFTISDKEMTTLIAWKKKQDAKTRKTYKGATMGQYHYTFCPTGIGTAIHVENALTKDVIDITDYQSW